MPNEMDGPAEITQEPIEPGETYSYEFTATQSGTYFYHSHDHVDRQQALGPLRRADHRPATPDPDLCGRPRIHRVCCRNGCCAKG